MLREPTDAERIAGRLTERRIRNVIEVTRSDTEAANIAIDKINEILTMDLKHLEDPNDVANSKVQKDN
jgi:chemotaxis signal transduction protein